MNILIIGSGGTGARFLHGKSAGVQKLITSLSPRGMRGLSNSEQTLKLGLMILRQFAISCWRR